MNKLLLVNEKTKKIILMATGMYRYIDTNYTLATSFVQKTLNVIHDDIFDKNITSEDIIQKFGKSDLFKKGLIANHINNINFYKQVEHKKIAKEYYMLLSWYFIDYLKEDVPNEIKTLEKNYSITHDKKINVVGYRELIQKGWTIDEIIYDLAIIDQITMPGMGDDLAGDSSKWLELYIKSKDSWKALEYKGRLIGYWHIVSLGKSDHKRTLAGKLDESKIKVIKNITEMKKPGKYKIYIDGVAILPEFRKMKNIKMLIDSFFYHIIHLAKKGVFLEEWTANAFTDQGAMMCTMVGMEYLKNHKSAGKIFYKKFMPIDKNNKFQKKYPELITLYSEAKK